MYLAANLQYLRRTHGAMTQERLAQQIGVSRQTVSKWESGEATPELGKLMELCGIFSCTLDQLLREDLAARNTVYFPVRILRIPGFRMARYVMISPNPQQDVTAYMEAWARRSGLLDAPGYTPKHIGWSFPYVSPEQKNRFGLRGYAAAYILPRAFQPACGGPEITTQEEACYAVLTIRDPNPDASRISQAYHLIFEYLSRAGIPKNAKPGFLPCFQRTYRQEGAEYTDVFVHCGPTAQAELFTEFI